MCRVCVQRFPFLTVYGVYVLSGIIVLKVSGRLLNPYCSLSGKLILEYSRLLSELYDSGFRIGVIVGGGEPARRYIGLAREIGVNETLCDIIGVMVSRVNAQLLISAIGSRAYPHPPESLEEYLRAWSTGRIVVSGGFQPGQSTTTVSALVAEALNARKLYIAASVDAVYDRDPKVYRNARKLKEITLSKLKRIVGEDVKAGTYQLIDLHTISILERSKIEVVLFDGRKPKLLLEAVKGGNPGTIIRP